MAIYHASMRMISRSGGNTVRALAYRTGTDLYDEKTGEWFYYSDKNVDHVDILLPEDAPQWAKDLKQELSRNRTSAIQKISNIAERAETRKNSRLYKEFEFALPKELTEAQNIKLATEFLQDQACQLGMMAIASFHFDVDEDTGEGRPHCHALMLTRRLEEQRLSIAKDRDWDKTKVLLTWREQLAGYVNFHLKMHGHNVQVDHRSYKDQGIDILPQPKLARGMKAMEDKIVFKQQGKTSQDQVMDRRAAYEKVRQHNVAKLIKRPETVFDIVTRGCSTFMWGDVEKVLARYVKEEAIYDRLKVQLEASRELVLLRQESRVSESGEPEDTSIYTTKTMLKNELSLVRLTEKLGKIQRHQVPDQKVQQAIQKTNEAMAARQQELSLDQVKAVHHVTRGDQLSCVVGYAGAGKSTMFKCAKEAWASSGYQVYGLAPTGRAAQNMEEIGISSQTLHKFLKEYEAGRCQYRRKTVLILDEAGLVDVQRFNTLMSAVDHLGVKLVIAGDGAQAQPIEAGPGFRLVTDRLNPQKLDTIIRQEVGWQREASRLFGTYQTQEALALYMDKGHVTFVEEEVKPLEDLVARGQHREIVTLYNLSRRLAGNVWHSMVEDMKKQEISSEAFLQEARHHEDYGLFKHWQDIRKNVSQEMIASLDTYRNLMSQQGVDPTAFAAQFVPYDLSEKDKALKIRELITTWGLQAPNPEKPLHQCDLRHQTRKQLIESWSASQEAHPEKSHLIVTYTNKDTALLNQDARSTMRLKGHLAIEEHIHTIQRESRDDFNQKVVHTEQKAFSQGERIVFTRNDKSLGVKNGTLGTLEEVDRHTLKVRLDGQGQEEGRMVSFASKLYPYFDQGWALTIIKSQGSTADHVFKLATYEEDRNLAYVGMTRHRDSLQVFGSKLDFWRNQIFKDRLSQSREKLSSLDYVSQEEAQSRIQPPARLKEALSSLGNKLESWGYTTHQKWVRISEIFTGVRPPQEDRLVVLPRVMDEVQRARDMGLMMTPQEGSQRAMSASNSDTRGSGPNRGNPSDHVIIHDDIASFLDRQEKKDHERARSDHGQISQHQEQGQRPVSLSQDLSSQIQERTAPPPSEISPPEKTTQPASRGQVVAPQAIGSESTKAEQWQKEHEQKDVASTPTKSFLNPSLDDWDKHRLTSDMKTALAHAYGQHFLKEDQEQEASSLISRAFVYHGLKPFNVYNQKFLNDLCKTFLLEDDLKNYLLKNTVVKTLKDHLEFSEKTRRVSTIVGTMALEQFYSQDKEIKGPEKRYLLTEALAAYDHDRGQEKLLQESLVHRAQISPEIASEAAKQTLMIYERTSVLPSREVQDFIVKVCQRQHQSYEHYRASVPNAEVGRTYWQTRTSQGIIESYFKNEGKITTQKIKIIEQEVWAYVDQSRSVEESILRREQQAAQERVSGRVRSAPSIGIEYD